MYAVGGTEPGRTATRPERDGTPRRGRTPLDSPAYTGMPPAGERLRVLLVEDDPADAFLVEELLLEARAPIELKTAATLAEARQRLAGVDCVLLDLRLPDANGLDALHMVLQSATGVAVCVLTGLEDEHLGITAVSAGAQDYLVKGQVDGIVLARAVRYAVERRQADENARRLREAELRQAESTRLERGLLPQPLIDPASARVFPFYRPGRHRALLGGDFYDAIESPAHRLHLLVGDVCGHGADEAALGAQLRVAWRALVLAGVPDDRKLHALEQVLVTERRNDEVFATVVTVTVDLDEGVAQVRLAGHPPPLLLVGSDRVETCEAVPGLVLGVELGLPCPTSEIELVDDWALLLYTDGLIEGRAAVEDRAATKGRAAARGRAAAKSRAAAKGRSAVKGRAASDADRLGVDGLRELLADPRRSALSRHELPAWLVGEVEQRNGGPLADDVAMLLVTGGRR
jgi:serine phosphatase RsbU (regulator of sigma subunit)